MATLYCPVPYGKIQDAENDANDGDLIVVGSNYPVNATIQDGVTVTKNDLTFDFADNLLNIALALNGDANKITLTGGGRIGIYGSKGNDIITGNNGVNQIITIGGNDTIDCGGGNDELSVSGSEYYDDPPLSTGGTAEGGEGFDLVRSRNLGGYSFSGFEQLNVDESIIASFSQLSSFGTFKNVASYNEMRFELVGAGGAFDFSSRVTGDSKVVITTTHVTSAIQVTGTNNADRFADTQFNDTLNGSNGNDTLTDYFGGDFDRFNGGVGNDLFVLGSKADAGGVIDGGSDTDTVKAGLYVFSTGDLGTFTFTGVETLATRAVNATIAQLKSFSSIIPDTTFVPGSNATAQIKINLRGAGGTIDFSNQVRDGNSINVTDLDVTSALTIIGTAKDDKIGGSKFGDTLTSGLGNDTLDGGQGVDNLNGGAGNDTYIVDDGNDKVAEAKAEGADTVTTTVSYALQTGSEVETLRTSDAAGVAAIDLTGNEFSNLIIGNAGINKIDAGAGNDTLDGGIGTDAMTGGLGNDIYYVDDVGDTVKELSGTGSGTDIVHTTLNTYTLSDNVEQLIFDGTGGFTATGNASDNRLTGGIGDDKFFTEGHTAALPGSDVFGGGTGTDAVFYTKATIGAVINLQTGTNGGAAAGDVYGSIEKFFGSNTGADTMTASNAGRATFSGQGGNDTLTGGATVDQLFGGAGNDVLKGDGGIDQLAGGIGNDSMDGGAGRDLFVFVEAKFGVDTINNYEDGQDRLKVFSAVADSVSDFTITGNDTTAVTLKLASDPTNVITIKAASAIHIDANDFLFY